MQYRKFGKTGWDVSILGFGCMRFPTVDNKGHGGNVIEDASIEMLHHAIDNGINYLDTAYGYHQKKSEAILGKFLPGKYRDKVKLATKLPTWLVKQQSDFDTLLKEQLERLNTDRIDVYLMHGLDAKRWPLMRDLKILEKAEEAKADGRIGAIGFSFHDNSKVLKEIVDAYDWSMCQVQYNYMDIDGIKQAGTEGVKYAAAKGMAVVIMEPLLGGRLANPPDSIKTIWNIATKKRSPVYWALQWVWNQPEVSLLLSGMSSMQQLKDNLVSADMAKVGSLTKEDQAVIGRVRETYKNMIPIPCTQCGYCMPCPIGISIPRNLEIYNHLMIYNCPGLADNWYNDWLTEKERASVCLGCKQCEEKCPQKIPISEWMPKIHQKLARK